MPATTRPVFSERLAAENSEAEFGEYWENVFCIQVTPFMNKAKASPSPRTTHSQRPAVGGRGRHVDLGAVLNSEANIPPICMPGCSESAPSFESEDCSNTRLDMSQYFGWL